MAVLEKAQFSPEDLAEHFPNAPLSEASYEIRFDPKLRIPSEIWKMQERVVSDCPNFAAENFLALGGTISPAFTFASRDRTRLIRASQQNLGIIMSSYPGFAPFRAKIVEWTHAFCEMFAVDTVTRIGLRYVNNILLPSESTLDSYVNPFVNLDRFSLGTKSQFVCEIRSTIADHDLMIRTALIKEPVPSYVLDIDCFIERPIKLTPTELDKIVLRFHESAKITFLEHIQPPLKAEFRRRIK